ncbi:PREDICTED: THO complex subunit 4-like [Ceratosolen solmsi marchali]|uniref:THO complex subunit 4-like n=1 Tax=Ceratosolen solmsi marchali TaxID=326594 RepID=A0AAJ6YI62_9HYME|nr:PREDICTED: THO complex subunit 4-like [Ceratosolen solmsi marchali]XP_011498513.1 PREDICTED: THO complex subunit 4-like [Ceratosolen solmsi marchali]
MEMSLDEIIKQNKSKRIRGVGRRGGSRRSGSSRGSRRPGVGVIRGWGRGGISRNRSSFDRKRSVSGPKRVESFLGGSGPLRKYGNNSDITKLIVSNLDFGVTDSDILELFSEFGPLKSAGVHYDRSGRSLGSADLIFERRADAIKAMTQYNGVPLDGREMNIQLATSEIPGTKSIYESRKVSRPSGSFNSRGTNRNGVLLSGFRGRGASGKRGIRGSRPAKKQLPTAEELDAELEEYAKSKITNSNGA